MGKNKNNKKSKKSVHNDYKAYLAKKSRVKLIQPNTGNKKEEKKIDIDTKSEFLESIKVTTNTSLPEQLIEERYEESEFVRKVRELTKEYTKPLDDIMLMYSETKGTDKMSLEEFTKYEMLQRELAKALMASTNSPKKAYMATLNKYPKDSDEAIILQGLIDEFSKTQER